MTSFLMLEFSIVIKSLHTSVFLLCVITNNVMLLKIIHRFVQNLIKLKIFFGPLLRIVILSDFKDEAKDEE